MFSATLRAAFRSSMQTSWVTQATLSLTYAPIGSACRIVSLYRRMSGAKSFGAPSEKHSAPKPSCAAFSNVDGLPQATQMGGCGKLYGFGSTLRSGIEKYVPSY